MNGHALAFGTGERNLLFPLRCRAEFDRDVDSLGRGNSPCELDLCAPEDQPILAHQDPTTLLDGLKIRSVQVAGSVEISTGADRMLGGPPDTRHQRTVTESDV